jgi:hypothetical protein
MTFSAAAPALEGAPHIWVDPRILDWLRRLEDNFRGGLDWLSGRLGNIIMAISGDPPSPTPPVGQKGSIERGANRQLATLLLGWREGRLFEYSSDRGSPIPPPHISNRGIVSLYSDGRDGNEAATGQAHVFFAYNEPGVGSATGRRFNSGPQFVPNVGMEGLAWWPTSDVWAGLLAFCYDSRTSGSGAAGQYTWIKERDPLNPRHFKLAAPFPVAVAPGDKICLGAIPFWLVFGEQAALPMQGEIYVRDGQIVLKRLTAIDGENPKMRVEMYPSGRNYEVNLPQLPYGANSLGNEYPMKALNHAKGIAFNFSKPAAKGGIGAGGHSFALALGSLGDRGDFAISQTAFEVLRGGDDESSPQA